MDRCHECGYLYEDNGPLHLAGRLASLGPRYGERLRTATGSSRRATLRDRPDPQVWSALEYACHVRDVLLAQRERLFLALVEDRPSFVPIYREQRVVVARYAAEDPDRVAHQLDTAAGLVADAFERLDEAEWVRECVYNFPVQATRTVAWLGAHTLHEGEHHLVDVDRVLAATGGTRAIRPGGPPGEREATLVADGERIAETPRPPYVAVIFTSRRSPSDRGYAETTAEMVALAAQQPGYLGMETARQGLGITVSYWRDEQAARRWKQVAEHLVAQRRGLRLWYVDYRVRVASVARDYGPADSELL